MALRPVIRTRKLAAYFYNILNRDRTGGNTIRSVVERLEFDTRRSKPIAITGSSVVAGGNKFKTFFWVHTSNITV